MPEALVQRIGQHPLKRAVRPVTIRCFPAPCSEPQRDPVRGSVAGSPPPLWVDEGFQVVDWMPVKAFPVSRYPRRQMRNSNPGQHQIPAVISDEPDVAPPRFPAPADKPIPRPQM